MFLGEHGPVKVGIASGEYWCRYLRGNGKKKVKILSQVVEAIFDYLPQNEGLLGYLGVAGTRHGSQNTVP